jgi:hypothetical protein
MKLFVIHKTQNIWELLLDIIAEHSFDPVTYKKKFGIQQNTKLRTEIC